MQWWNDRKVDKLSRAEYRPRGEDGLWKDEFKSVLDLLSRFASEKSRGRP